MDEHDLRALTDDMNVRPHSIDTILRRSRQIRRRGHAVKALGATAVVAGLFAATALADGRETVEMVPTDTAPTDPPPECVSQFVDEVPEEAVAGIETSPSLPLDQIDDSLRFLPSVVPEGMAVTKVEAWAPVGDDPFCSLDPVLSFQADGGDSTIEATIKVSSLTDQPFDKFHYAQGGETSEVPLRGATAALYQADAGGGRAAFTALTWSDGAGSRWLIEASGTDSQTVLDVAEGLVLDPAARPAATLPGEAVPSGFDLVWQAGESARPGPGFWWYVTLKEGEHSCYFRITDGGDPAPAEASAGPGAQRATVHGQPAVMYPGSVRWDEPSGVGVEFICSVDTGVLLQVAESLELVAADDPRLPRE